MIEDNGGKEDEVEVKDVFGRKFTCDHAVEEEGKG